MVLLSAPVIVLNSYRGIANTPRSLVEMSGAFLASRWQRVWKVVIPAGSGLIFAGLRLGLAQGFTGVVLAELIITPTGVGDLITYNRSVAELPCDVRGDPVDHPGRERQRDAAAARRAAPVPSRDEAGMSDAPITSRPGASVLTDGGRDAGRPGRRARQGVRRRRPRPRWPQLRRAQRRAHQHHRAERVRQDHDAQDHRGADRGDVGTRRGRRHARHRSPGPTARSSSRTSPSCRGRPCCATRPSGSSCAASRARSARRPRARTSTRSGCRASRTPTRTSSPAACGNASAWRARWRWTRTSC